MKLTMTFVNYILPKKISENKHVLYNTEKSLPIHKLSVLAAGIKLQCHSKVIFLDQSRAWKVFSLHRKGPQATHDNGPLVTIGYVHFMKGVVIGYLSLSINLTV